MAEATKKPRGRPRKSPAPATSSQDPVPAAAAKPAEAPKKRGRPTKDMAAARAARRVSQDAKMSRAKLPEIVTAVALAELLGISTVWLNELTKNGFCFRHERGFFELRPSVLGFIRYKQEGLSPSTRATPAADSLKNTRAQEIRQRMAERDRTLISLAEAQSIFEDIAGAFLEVISALPARITQVPRERTRIETLCDEDRQRLADRFAKSRQDLRVGRKADKADDEDDA